MNELYTPELISLGAALTKLALKGTATAVANKIKAIKGEKNTEKVRSTYDEIVNELLAERDEAILIAQSYKSELERVVISDDDIEHLHNTVSRLLEILKEAQISSVDQTDKNAISAVNEQITTFEQIKELISVDTLKTMQLIGFNYKAAIGEPLTVMLKNYLLSIGPKNEDSSLQSSLTPEMVEVLKNQNAYKNLKELIGIPTLK
jgi:hypothetical protein